MATGHDKFWPIDDRPARVICASHAPYILADGTSITVKIDQETPAQVSTLATADFVNIALATAAETAYVLDRDLEDCRAYVFETPSLLVDGDMDLLGVAAWTAVNAAVLTKENNPGGDGLGTKSLRITYNAVANPGARQSILTVGSEYRVRGWARGNGINVPKIYCGNAAVVSWTGLVNTYWQYFDFTVTATADTFFTLAATVGFAGWVEFDGVTVTAKQVAIESLEYGADSYVEVTGGAVNVVLAFDTTETQGTSDGTLNADADPQGKAIDLSWYLWTDNTAAVNWDGQFKILYKQGEYPREHDDAAATVAFTTTYVGPPFTKDQQTLAIPNLSPGVVYYFSFFVWRVDLGIWVYDEDASFAWCFPFDQWGHSAWMFEHSPAKDQRNDTSGDWAAWLSIFGTLLDGKKTEIDQIGLFYDMRNVRADLIPYHDHLLGWPTNYELAENDQRNETQNVIPLWQKKGREISVTFQIEQISSYDVELADGWKYVHILNDPDCIQPDTSDPTVASNIGRWDDRLFYQPDIGHWHDVNGWGVFFFPIAASGVLTKDMIEKTHRVMGVVKPSFVDYDLILELAAVEEIPLPPTDEDEVGFIDEEAPLPPTDEATTLVRPHFLLLTNDVDTVQNNRWAMQAHSSVTWSGDHHLLAAAMFNDDPAPIAIDFVRNGALAGEDWTENGTISIVADGSAFGGSCVDLSGAVSSFLGIVAMPALDYVRGEFTISLRVQPQYSGSPAADQTLLAVYAGVGNDVGIEHLATGNLQVQVFDAAPVLIYNQAAAWSPTAGVWYDLELNFSDTAGTAYARLFVDGVQLLGAAVTGVHGGCDDMLIGVGAPITNDFLMDELLIYNEVKHTAGFTPPTEELWGYADVYP